MKYLSNVSIAMTEDVYYLFEKHISSTFLDKAQILVHEATGEVLLHWEQIKWYTKPYTYTDKPNQEFYLDNDHKSTVTIQTLLDTISKKYYLCIEICDKAHDKEVRGEYVDNVFGLTLAKYAKSDYSTNHDPTGLN